MEEEQQPLPQIDLYNLNLTLEISYSKHYRNPSTIRFTPTLINLVIKPKQCYIRPSALSVCDKLFGGNYRNQRVPVVGPTKEPDGGDSSLNHECIRLTTQLIKVHLIC